MFDFFPPVLLSDKYAVRFIPRENGLYLIDVKFNGSHIPGSPFKIRVGETGQAGDPGMVSAYGAGLEGGNTGESEARRYLCSWWSGAECVSCIRKCLRIRGQHK